MEVQGEYSTIAGSLKMHVQEHSLIVDLHNYIVYRKLPLQL